MKDNIIIFWFRRDLRLEDNKGLIEALQKGLPVLCIFIFDKNILDKLSDKSDKRVSFIHKSIIELQEQLVEFNSSLKVFHDTPLNTFKQLTQLYSISHVFANHDYERYGIERDQLVNDFLSNHQIAFHTYKDQVIFEKKEVVKDSGDPYTVFTPYSKKWKAIWRTTTITFENIKDFKKRFFKIEPQPIPEMADLGFQNTPLIFPEKNINSKILLQYNKNRDFPGITGTSHLGIHLRFGTISIRLLAKESEKISEAFLNELIWRDFYHMICWNFPHINHYKSFKPAYDQIQWVNNEKDFESWCMGNTGYPIVDAGMRELNETGFMHNRVRMIVASFLCKHLLIDWRWGEAYFAEKLLDFDFAANNGGWQWAAGSGCDAAPYFRIFNPYLQTKKFDPDLTYIKKWVPEYQEFNYPKPIINHEVARKRCLEVYKKGLQS